MLALRARSVRRHGGHPRERRPTARAPFAVLNLLALPLLPARPDLPRPRRPGQPAGRGGRRRHHGDRRLRRSSSCARSRSSSSATGSPTHDLGQRHRRLGSAPPADQRGRSCLRAGRHGRRHRPVGVVRSEGRALRAVLLLRTGGHRPPRSQRRRQDDAHAGHDGPAGPEHGHRSGARARPSPRPLGPAVAGARAGGRGRTCGADCPPARPLRRAACTG